jgi:hypothetical protein
MRLITASPPLSQIYTPIVFSSLRKALREGDPLGISAEPFFVGLVLFPSESGDDESAMNLRGETVRYFLLNVR